MSVTACPFPGVTLLGVTSDSSRVPSELGDDRAVEYARRAYEAMPESPAIADTLGWLLVERGDYEGVEILERAATLAPESPDIQYHYATGLARQGDTQEASETLADHLHTHPNFESRSAAEALAAELK